MFDAMVQSIGIPLAAGLLCLLLPGAWDRVRAWLAIAATALTLWATCVVYGEGNRVLEIGSLPLLRVDALSGLVLVASAAFALLIAVYSLGTIEWMTGEIRSRRRSRSRQTLASAEQSQSLATSATGRSRVYYSTLLGSLALSCGVILANDLILLLVCWGLLALTLYLMIGLAGPDASQAARKTFLIVGGSDALLLLGTVLLWNLNGSTLLDGHAVSLDSTPARIAFLCFTAAAFAKAGAIPLHSWLPDAGEKAWAPVTAFLPAALDKLLGIYLLARVVMNLFEMTHGMNTLLMLLGSITVIGAVMMALVQHDLKRLLAFHAVSQVGYMVMGIGSGTLVGLAGGLFHMLNHAIYKSCLFLGAGVVEQKTGTVDLDRLGGLATRLPITFAACLVASLSISGIPPLNGFASKWMVYQGIIESGKTSGDLLWVVWLTAAVAGSALTLASFVKVLHGVFLCKPSPEVRSATIARAGWSTAIPLIYLAGLCVLFGVFAHQIPLRLLILPAVGESVEFSGTWRAGQVSGLLLLAILLGWGMYALTLRNGKLRRVPTFIGGERMDETRIPGVPLGPERHVEVTGVDFYRTVEDLPFLKGLYSRAHRRAFDVYHVCGRVTARMAEQLRGAHSGLLPSYLSWSVLGVVVVLYLMMGGTR